MSCGSILLLFLLFFLLISQWSCTARLGSIEGMRERGHYLRTLIISLPLCSQLIKVIRFSFFLLLGDFVSLLLLALFLSVFRLRLLSILI